jgi:large subunit ribosomal protein L15
LKAAGLVPAGVKRAKVIASGAVDKPVSLKGIAVTKGARRAIEAAGGTVEQTETRKAGFKPKQR